MLATRDGSVGGSNVDPANVTLPTDGTYTLHVNAPPSNTASVGNYVVTAWETTPTFRPLSLNQAANGSLAAPYAEDRWTFSALAGQQVQLRVLGLETSGIAFTLTGPNGYTGFTGISADSPLLTLPTDGAYTLSVASPTGAVGNYAFNLNLISQTAITLNTPHTDSLTGSGRPLLFRVGVPESQVLTINLDDAATTGHTELYARFNSPPTREDFDYSATGAGRRQSLFVPSASPGAWYILVYGENIPSAGSFTLTARGASAKISEVFPTRTGNAAPATLTIKGAGFVRGTTVALVGTGGTVYSPTSTSIELFTQISSTFPTGLPADAYSAHVTRGATSETTPNALTITAGGKANLETNRILPPQLGRHAVATLYVGYANTGDVAMPAQLLSLQSADTDDSDKPILTLDEERIIENFWSRGLPPGTSNTALILGSGKQPGVLNPGERIRVPVYYLGLLEPWNFGDTQVEMEIRYWTENDPPQIYDSINGAPPPPDLADYNHAIDWSARKDTLKPATLSTDQ